MTVFDVEKQGYTWHNFPNYGFIQAKLTEHQMYPIIAEINLIQQDFSKFNDRLNNFNLAGHIKKQFIMQESFLYTEQLLKPLIDSYNSEFNYLENFTFSNGSKDLHLDKCWINFQSKNEFNPTHNHSGVLSFVIWVKVPYDIDNEAACSPGYESNSNCAGMFEFTYSKTNCGLFSHRMPVSKEHERIVTVFPSTLIHQVYPFFSSEEYRISVSGNFKFKV
jgi:uncharacterized protein (TIGR02466 family)